MGVTSSTTDLASSTADVAFSTMNPVSFDRGCALAMEAATRRALLHCRLNGVLWHRTLQWLCFPGFVAVAE
uniref:Uncharacterized protein n=1 Tax=Setaria viridis TaxID=4556 RepID=A0A4U6VNT6_SETVI|nr:hypothetical protein SEVIR_2G104150v2 [Setaria viridis]